MNLLQKCAEILVECGYAKALGNGIETIRVMRSCHKWLEVRPFTDTLEGRRQADAIEDWIQSSGIPNMKLWIHSGSISGVIRGDSHHQWRLDRIKWCIEELIK